MRSWAGQTGMSIKLLMYRIKGYIYTHLVPWITSDTNNIILPAETVAGQKDRQTPGNRMGIGAMSPMITMSTAQMIMIAGPYTGRCLRHCSS